MKLKVQLHSGQEKVKKWASLNRKGALMRSCIFEETCHFRLKREKLKGKANANFVIDMLILGINELDEDYEVTVGHVVHNTEQSITDGLLQMDVWDRRQLSSSFRFR